MTKQLQNIIPAGLLKTGLAIAIALTTCLTGYGQDLKSKTSPEQQLSRKEARQIMGSGWEPSKNGKSDQQAISLNARVAAAHSFPQNSQLFSADAAGTGWILEANVRYTYDAQGNPPSYTMVPVLSQYPSLKDSSLYDLHGNRTFNASYTRLPSSTTWQMDGGTRNQYIYNTAGLPIEIITEDYNSVAWVLTGKEVIVYNTAGYATEKTSYKWLNNTWEPFTKTIYGFTGAINPPSSITLQSYNGGWVNLVRQQNLTWHNFALNEYLTMEEQMWSNNAWVSLSRSTVVYDSFGGSVNVSESFNGSTWENAGRNSITKNSHSDITGFKHEGWHNNSWVFGDERQFLLTYNTAGQLTESIYKNWNSATNTMINTSREVYSNFLVMGTRKDRPALSVKIYPNPTTEFIQLEFSEKGNVKATLTDLTGKVVLSQKLAPSGNRQLSLCNLPTGTYLLKLETPKGSSFQKIIKQ